MLEGWDKGRLANSDLFRLSTLKIVNAFTYNSLMLTYANRIEGRKAAFTAVTIENNYWSK